MLNIDPDEPVDDQRDTLVTKYPQVSEDDAETIYEAMYDKVEDLSEDEFPRAEGFQLGDMTDVGVWLARTVAEQEAEGVEYVEADDVLEKVGDINHVDMYVLKRYTFSGNADD